jgi:hypothetical protein
MTSEKTPAPANQDHVKAPRATVTGPVEHWCQYPGCKNWGSRGYDRGKGETDWYCFEHRPEARQNDAAR